MEQETSQAASSTPQDKADLLERIQAEWSALLRCIEPLSEAQLTRPGPGGWSVKDNLAHLTAWEQFMLRHYLHGQPAHAAMQMDAATYAGLDEDGLNAVLHERGRGRAVADVLADLHGTHQQVVATLEGTAFAELMHPLAGDVQGRPVLAWVTGNTYEHYYEHRLTIQAMTSS